MRGFAGNRKPRRSSRRPLSRRPIRLSHVDPHPIPTLLDSRWRGAAEAHEALLGENDRGNAFGNQNSAQQNQLSLSLSLSVSGVRAQKRRKRRRRRRRRGYDEASSLRFLRRGRRRPFHSISFGVRNAFLCESRVGGGRWSGGWLRWRGGDEIGLVIAALLRDITGY